MSESTTQASADRYTIRVALPFHLRNLAGVGPEISLDVAAPITVSRVLDALETAYPMLRGTIREYETGKRRAFLRFFACQEDLSNEGMDVALPAAVVEGSEPLLIIGAIAGG
jgi:sulfur-carrier protein